MKENTQKREQTKRKIKDAVMLLYASDGLYQITITGVCKEAAIHRSTFYFYYQTIDEVIKEVEDGLLDSMYQFSDKADFSLFASGDLSKSEMLSVTKTLLTEYYTWMFSMRHYFLPLLAEDGDILFLKKFENHLYETYARVSSQLKLDFNNEYALDYIVGGTFRTNLKWLKQGNISAEQLVDFQMKLFLNH